MSEPQMVNADFAPESVLLGESAATAPDMPIGEPNDAAGWHPLTLPSLGQFYGGKCPSGQVYITPWTTMQEEALVRYSDQGPGKLMAGMVSQNVRLPGGLMADELLTTDQYFLLVQLRAISLTRFVTLLFNCPACSKSSEKQLDLTQLKTRTPEPDEQEPFEVWLPKCDVTVELHFSRVKDALAIAEYKKNNSDGALRYRYARQIDTINGESKKFDEKKDFVSKLILLDLQEMTDMIEQNETGLVTQLQIACDHCGRVEDEWEMPMTDSFFRPRRSDIRAEIDLARQARRGD